MQLTRISNYTDVLASQNRSPEIPEAADAYGWLVGSWELDCRRYAGEPVSNGPTIAWFKDPAGNILSVLEAA